MFKVKAKQKKISIFANGSKLLKEKKALLRAMRETSHGINMSQPMSMKKFRDFLKSD